MKKPTPKAEKRLLEKMKANGWRCLSKFKTKGKTVEVWGRKPK